MSSAPVPGATGLSEPLLGDGGGDGGALTKVVVATALDGKAKANKGSEAKDGYWVEVPRQLDAAAATAADLESGGGDGGRLRALMFQEKKVKASLLYPYRALILIRIISQSSYSSDGASSTTTPTSCGSG